MKKFLTIVTLAHLSLFQFVTTKENKPYLTKKWKINKEPKRDGVDYWTLQNKKFANNKPLVIYGLPCSQTVRNIQVVASVGLECTSSKTGKTISAPKPEIKMSGRYRDYSQTFTYNFSKVNEPVTCKLTVSSEDDEGEKILKEDIKGKIGFEFQGHEVSENTEIFTFYVTPAKSKK